MMPLVAIHICIKVSIVSCIKIELVKTFMVADVFLRETEVAQERNITSLLLRSPERNKSQVVTLPSLTTPISFTREKATSK